MPITHREQLLRSLYRAFNARDVDACLAVTERQDGTTEVAVHLVGRDSEGQVVFDDHARHVYAFRGDLVERMTIEK
jgi:hypothetical protein